MRNKDEGLSIIIDIDRFVIDKMVSQILWALFLKAVCSNSEKPICHAIKTTVLFYQILRSDEPVA